MSVKVEVRKVRAAAELPRYMSEGAAGCDAVACVSEPVRLAPGARAAVPTGLAFAVPDGYEVQVRPRSGLSSRFGVTLVNSPGTIDADYRGEVQVPMINHGKQPFVVERNMRIAQMVVMPVPPVELVEVDELDSTTRGTGGFGHTGR